MGLGLGVAAELVLALVADVEAVTLEGQQREARHGQAPLGGQGRVGVVGVARHAVGRIALLQGQQGQVQEARHVEHDRRAQHEHALARAVGVVLGVQVEAGGEAEAAGRPPGQGGAADLAEVQQVAVDDIDLLRAGAATDGGIAAVGDQHVGIEEVHAVLVAAGMGQGDDGLADVIGAEGLGEALAVAHAQRGVAPVGGGGRRGEAERSQGQGERGLAGGVHRSPRGGGWRMGRGRPRRAGARPPIRNIHTTGAGAGRPRGMHRMHLLYTTCRTKLALTAGGAHRHGHLRGLADRGLTAATDARATPARRPPAAQPAAPGTVAA